MAAFELLPWQPAFAADIAPLADDPGIAANLRDAFPSPYTLPDAQAFVANCIQGGNRGHLLRAIVVDGRAVGSIGLFAGQDIYRQSAELGYWLGRPFWGRGMMTEAVGRLCAEAFSRLPIVRIYAEPFAHNTASRRVLEKSGFVLEGTMRLAAVKNGKLLDWCMYALLKEPDCLAQATPLA
ncbi:MAG: N-acetyltransferase [Clostridia bacterium]|nr:N-acetyltransferase [Clostridia bacterium]